MPKRGQGWSMDVLVSVGLFVAGLLLLYYFIGERSDTTLPPDIIDEGRQIPELLSTEHNETIGFIDGGKIDREKLEQFANITYNETKKILGVQSDFCIYFEDEEGYIVNVSGPMVGIGSEKGKISGIDCGELVSG
jgi:hypothetical protein